jgi:hypothetical protein
MDADMEKLKGVMEPKWEQFGLREGSLAADKFMELINREDFRAGTGGSAPMAKTPP